MSNQLQKYVTFVLDKKHTSPDPRRSGSNRGISIPAKDIVNEVDPKTGVINKRVIVYNPSNGQRSLYVDEWKNYKGETDFRLLSAPKINFFDKIKILDPQRNAMLIEFLRLTNANGSNENRESTSEVLFTEESESSNKAVSLDNEELVFKATEFIIQSREENLIQVADLLGLSVYDRNNVPLTEKELKMDLISHAKRKPQELIDIIQDPRLEMKVELNRAFTLGVIKFDNLSRQIIWTDTKEPVISVKVRKGMLPIDILVNYCADSAATGKEAYNDIMYKLNGEVEDDHILIDNPDVVDSFTEEELVDAAKDAGILVQSGAYLFLDSKTPENQLSKGKNGVVKMLKEDVEHNGFNLKSYITRAVKLSMNKSLAKA